MLAPLLPEVEAEAAAEAADEDVAVSEVLEPLEVAGVEAAEPVELVVTVPDVVEPAVEPTVAVVADEPAVAVVADEPAVVADEPAPEQ